jgi:outer membrane protein OmpA-like peptidoglycan-associated protein
MKKSVIFSLAALFAIVSTGCNKKLTQDVAANQQAISKIQYELSRQAEEIKKLQDQSANDSIDGVAIKDIIIGQQYQIEQMNKQLTKARKDLYRHLQEVGGLMGDSAQFDLREDGFKVGSAKLSAKAQQALDNLVPQLQENKTWSVKVFGHTDNTGSDKVNDALSVKRAESVKKYLSKKGIEAERISVKGMGSSKPVVCNDDANNRAKNRRVEVIIVK